MKGDQQRAVLSDTDVLAAIASDRCLCGAVKASGAPFCTTDYTALSLPARLALADPSRRLDAYRSASRHLESWKPRRRIYSGSAALSWPYASDADLTAAGFQFCDHAVCRVPGCGQRITWYRFPRKADGTPGARIAVNLADARPHRTTCADAEYFARRRALQTSARLRRRAAR